MKRVELARVTVNKAADQYVRAEEVGPAAPAALGDRWGETRKRKRTERSGRTVARSARRPASDHGEEAATPPEARRPLMQVYERFCLQRDHPRGDANRAERLIQAFNDRGGARTSATGASSGSASERSAGGTPTDPVRRNRRGRGGRPAARSQPRYEVGTLGRQVILS